MKIISILALAVLCQGCTVVYSNRVFPTVAWYWSADAKYQRQETAQENAYHQAYLDSLKTNTPAK